MQRLLAAGLTVVAAATLVGTAPVSAAAGAQPAAAQTTSAHPQHSDNTRGHWLVQPTPTGQVLVWRSPHRLAVTDGRPEFRVGARVLGYPQTSADGRGLRLPLTTAAPTDLTAVEAWLGVRRLDARTPAAPTPAYQQTQALPGAETPAAADPADPGPYAVDEFDYTDADLALPPLPAPVEVLGHAVLPVGVPHAPLVLFLHGRHQACYGPDDEGGWPCAGDSQPVPSYLGYTYLQRMLAGQGYATVSISANGINAQDGDTNDGGAGARSRLVRHHLGLLAGWNATSDDPRLTDRLDLTRVVLVGHSRGGEGVDQAAIDATPDDPFRIVGQVLIAPTDFAYQSAPYTPTELLLGYCDGDVYDLQGQRYVDAPAELAPDDPSLRSSVLLMGANHNYFNTEWTPHLSAAPSFDDWGIRRDPVCGRRVSDTRLTAAEQRRAAMTYVAAGVHAFLGDRVHDALEYLDADGPVALPDAGPAQALTHALGGDRLTVGLGDGAAATGVAGPCRAGHGDDSVPGAEPLCGLRDYTRQVHWTEAWDFDASVHSAYAAAGLPLDMSMHWKTPGVVGGFALSEPLDLSNPADVLDLRVVVDPRRPPPVFRVLLSAAGRTWVGPVQSLAPLPGSSMVAALWAQTVRIDPTTFASRPGLAHVDAVELQAVSPRGHLWVLDASRRSPGLMPVPERMLPRINLGHTAQAEGDGAATAALVPFHVTGDVTAPATFAVAVEQSTWDDATPPAFHEVTVEPGQTDGTISVPYEADRLQDRRRQVERVHAVARRGTVMSGFLGGVSVIDDDPAPDVTWRPARRYVDYGDDVVFRLRLSTPVDYYVVNWTRARGIAGYPELRTSDVPRRWLRAQFGRVPPDARLSRVWRYGYLDLPPGATTALLSVPTLTRPLHERQKALSVVFRSRRLTTSAMRAYAVVRPAGGRAADS